MSSNYSDSKIIVWFVLTVDIKNEKMIDNAIVGVFKTYFDTYYESYFRIEKDYSFKSIISSSYESAPVYNESDYSIAPNGKINRLLTKEYSYDEDNNLQSFRNMLGGYEVVFYEDSYDDGTPKFDLKYYLNNKADSLLNLKESITLLDNDNRKWLTIYKYIDINDWKNSAHYRRYFYDSKSQVNLIHEVNYDYLNDSVMLLSFKKAISDSILDGKSFINFNFFNSNHSRNEPWLNSYFNLNSYDEIESKFSYLKR